jgi:TM2 domain-containing membrane protein YozV/RNA polymerase subunit RPABC4/transcription elongation factor Spt4
MEGPMQQTICKRCGESTADRYCPDCGSDLTPGQPKSSENRQLLAADRERSWLEQHPQAVTSKACPDCAEQVQLAANVCRYCGYRFDGAPAAAPAPPVASSPSAVSQPAVISTTPREWERSALAGVAREQKSPVLAAVLGFLIAGLGHMYLREFGRGILIFVSALMVGTGLALLDSSAAFLSLLIPVLSSRDAYLGAKALNNGDRPRQVTGLLWGVGGVALTLMIIGSVGYSDGGAGGGAGAGGGTGAGIDTAAVEGEIRPELERQLQAGVPDATVTVDSVDCVAASAEAGSCIAAVSDSLGNDTSVGINFTVDANSGEFIWKTDS